MTDAERIARGKRIYEACVVWFGLAPGESADLHVNGDLTPEGGGIVLEDGRVVVSGPDGVALAAYVARLTYDVEPRPAPQYPETHTLGGIPREQINVSSPVDRPGPWKGEERL